MVCVRSCTTLKRAQRKLSRAKKGSESRRQKARALAKAHRREKERAVQADFRLAHRLVSTYDGIAVERLNVAAMLKTKMFSKQMSDQRWSALQAVLEYKAAKAGIRHV
ncbi:MAG: transposase, partial [Actinomycetia bacterium]|nr:transposase [Actinomycetes bacterium]